MPARNLLAALTALLALGLLAPAAMSAHLSGTTDVSGCTNVFVGAEVDDDSLLGGLNDDEVEEQAAANVCLDQSFQDARSGNSRATEDNDAGLLGDVLGDEGDNDEGLLGDVLGDDGDNGSDLLGDVLGDEGDSEGGLLG